MAKFVVKGVFIDPKGIEEFITDNPDFKDTMMGIAKDVATEAQNTADSAQNGPEGDLTTYASSGFTVEWQKRGGKRPRVVVRSNADPQTALAVHFYTQKRDGVGHLRKALYKFTTRG